MDENEAGERAGFGRGGGRGFGRGKRWMGDYSLIDIRLVEPALLAFLSIENSHGYGLLEKLSDFGLSSINPSLIYRILRDYEEFGLVQSDWDKETTQGPPKRVYTITTAGEAALKRAAESLQGTLERIETLLSLIDKNQKRISEVN